MIHYHEPSELWMVRGNRGADRRERRFPRRDRLRPALSHQTSERNTGKFFILFIQYTCVNFCCLLSQSGRIFV